LYSKIWNLNYRSEFLYAYTNMHVYNINNKIKKLIKILEYIEYLLHRIFIKTYTSVKVYMNV